MTLTESDDAVLIMEEEDTYSFSDSEATNEILPADESQSGSVSDFDLEIEEIAEIAEADSVYADESCSVIDDEDSDDDEDPEIVSISASVFPDSVFRTYILENIDEDSSGTLSQSEINSVSSLNVEEMEITTLEGIRYFTKLTSLTCGYNNLTALDVSANTNLTYLRCYHNQLESLYVNGTALVTLNCNSNSLTSLDVSNLTALTTLYCQDNLLTTLDLGTNTALKYLHCDNNNLESLNVSGCDSLLLLYCSNDDSEKGNNHLTSLDISNCILLYDLNCGSNNLTELNVNNNTALIRLSCSDNSLSQLDLSANQNLEALYCGNNNLNNLDVAANTSLEVLDCNENGLENLDISKNTLLEQLYCHENDLTELNLDNNTSLKTIGCYSNNLLSLELSKNTALTMLICHSNNLTSLNLSENVSLGYLSCSGNSLTELDLSHNTALVTLYCNNNSLTELDISKNTQLVSLYCDNNNLTTLDVSANSNLTRLYCGIQTCDVRASWSDGILSISLGDYISVEDYSSIDLSSYAQEVETGELVYSSEGGEIFGFSLSDGVLTLSDALATTLRPAYSCSIVGVSTSDTMNVVLIITNKNITSCTSSISSESYTYDGNAKTPTVTVTDGSATLTQGTDYTVSFSNNVNAGTATVTITGIGDYYGVITKTFEIEPADISEYTVLSSDAAVTYDGSAQEPDATVKTGVHHLTKDVDFTLSYENNVNAGTATIIATGMGNYTGEATGTFKINKAYQSFTVIGPSAIKAGETGTILASAQGEISFISADGSIATVNNYGIVTGISPGSVIITVNAAETDNYNSATKTIEVTIIEGDQDDSSDGTDDTGTTTTLISDTSDSTSITSTDLMKEGVISSLTNTKKGITIKWSKVSKASGYYIYRKTGSGSYKKIKTIKKAATTSYSDTTVKSKNGTKYTYKVVPYSGNTKGSGTGKVIVRLTGNSISGTTNKSPKKMVIKWKKDSKVSGYQIQYSTNKKFKSGSATNTVKVSGSSKTNKTLTRLKKGKTYYLRIRTYKTVSGNTYYSPWSSVTTVKIKK
ncbi:MAG: fibronectin type III domain-containing protein [Lachnospiraceae bacterium]|nr:fibronectin type III domain-containing protein [Lachnospiraceae bacterium]